MKAHFLVQRQLSSLLAVSRRAEGSRLLSGISFIRALILFTALTIELLPKGPPSNTITLGLRFQHMNLMGIHILSTAG